MSVIRKVADKRRIRQAIWVKHGRRCWLCEKAVTLKDMTLDHVLPRSAGGSNRQSNLRPAHKSCNERRGNKPACPVCAGDEGETLHRNCILR